MNTGMDMYGTNQMDLQGSNVVEYRGNESESHIRLRQPKRTMSAYACFSRSMWVQQSGMICRFKQVREELGDQPRQCDIFKVIAGRWKEMSPEEKAPFEEEVVIMAMDSRAGGKGPPAIQERDATIPQAAPRGGEEHGALRHGERRGAVQELTDAPEGVSLQ